MFKRGLLILSIMLVMVFMVMGSVSASYEDDVITILDDVIYDMGGFSDDINLMINESISVNTFMSRTDRKKANALGNLKAVIRASEKASNENLHADIVSLISSWYLTVELVEKGVKNGDINTINGATEVMIFVGEKAENLTSRLE